MDGAYLGAAELQPTIETMLAAHLRRMSGRAVVFGGSTTIPATSTVGDLLASTAIDHVHVIGGRTPDPGTTLLTRNFVRPRWGNGDLVLHAQPAFGGVLVPFETPDPTPCCAAHS